MKLLDEFPYLRQVVNAPLNLIKARSIIPGIARQLTGLEGTFNKLNPDQIDLLHVKPDGNSVLTNEQMALLKQDPLKFLAEYPDSALAFDVEKDLRRNIEVNVGHENGVGITYRSKDGRSEEIIVFPNSTDTIARQALSNKSGEAIAETKPTINFDYLSRLLNVDYKAFEGATKTLGLINTALAA